MYHSRDQNSRDRSWCGWGDDIMRFRVRRGFCIVSATLGAGA